MEEVRQLVQEEGREARNLVAFHVAVDSPASKVSRKPPRSLPPAPRPVPRTSRLRSASAGRDKRSELRARYWALLFGDLQRAIGEIYNTVEANENLNECQEVILVLENYTRDFKALAEWFRLKWEYDNTPPPQRPQSLAWEIRKTDFVKPEPRRAYSVKSSPTVSGKNSPCLSGHNTPSGKNSPNLTGKASPGSGKISPRISSSHSSTSPKANIEFFSNKINASKVTAKPEPKIAKELSRLSDIKEKDIKETCEDVSIIKENGVKDKEEPFKPKIIEIGHAKLSPSASPKLVVVKSHKSKTNTDTKKQNEDISCQAKSTIDKLNAMESEYLQKQLVENKTKNDNMLNRDLEIEQQASLVKENKEEIAVDDKDRELNDSPTKSEDNFADVSSDSSPKSIANDKTAIVNVNVENSENRDDILNEMDIKNDYENSSPSCIDVKMEISTESIIIVTEDFNIENINEKETSLNATTNDSLSDYKELAEKEEAKEAMDIKVKDDSNQDSKESGNSIDKKDETESAKDSIKNIEDVAAPTKLNELEKNTSKEQDNKKSEAKPTSKPAYSQAAAKPKAIYNTKSEVKTPIRLARSSTVVEIRPPVPKVIRPFQKKVQTNKCSYPFNLTTGRTSLFDATPSPNVNRGQVVPRKSTARNIHMGAGDAKLVTNRPILKARSRPTSLRDNEKGDKREKVSTFLEKVGHRKTSVPNSEMNRNESNESIKTLVPEDLKDDDDVNSIEVFNVDSKNDNDGWLTVKSRRESKKQSKTYWANRFRQPSATASLPTLNMLESPKEETKSIVEYEVNKTDRAKSEQPQKIDKDKEKKTDKIVKVAAKPKSEGKQKDPAMRRQKSDVTGLKTRVSKNKVLTKKAEKTKGVPKETKNRLHSSLESLTMGLSRSQESVHEEFDFDKWKAEFKSTFNFLDDDDHISDHNEILKSADPSEMSEIAEMTSQIEENERKISLALDFQSEVDQRKLCEEEDLLNRQIMELQQVSDIELDTETDDTETDAEIPLEEPVPTPVPISESLGSLAASLEDQYETALAGMSWAERVDTLVVLEALVARDPGRAQQLHAKLSQGIKRRGSLQDALRRLQAKQARAERQRMEFQTEKSKRIHQLLARVEEVKVAKNQLIEEKKSRMERRLQKAAENRDQHLKDIVRKAHDEEEKLREIAFIKQLEAENRRHEFLEQCRSHTARLRLMRRDRLAKLEQKAAREAAVGARRQALEAARKLQMENLIEKRKERDARLEEMKEQKRQERDDAAREKAEAVKSRLSALAEAAELEADMLRSRIRDKQDASLLRHSSHLQAIREKATGPRQPTTSESQEKEMAEELEREELEKKEKEKQKSIKKKARKMKQKLLSSGSKKTVFDTHVPNQIEKMPTPFMIKTNKLVGQLNNVLQTLRSATKKIENDNKKKPKKNHEKNVESDENDENCNNKKKPKPNNVKADSCEKETLQNGDLNERTGNLTSTEVPNGHDDVNATIDNNNDETSNAHVKSKKKKAKNNDTDEKVPNGQEPSCSKKKKNVKRDLDTESSSSRKKKKKNKDILSELDIDFDEDNKKRRKRNRNHDLANLLSDISKCKGRKEFNTGIDAHIVEKLLNELNRSVEKLESDSSESAALQRYAAVKVTYELLGLIAERDDVAAILSTKCVMVGVTLLSRTLTSCPVLGSQLAPTDMCVHLITLLADLLEKDLKSDPKLMELAKQIADCLSVSFDAVLCTSRIFDESPSKAPEDAECLNMFRIRTHQFITYLCLSGCLERAEKAGEARESIQTLLTVCADLCHPCAVDTGKEREAARQALKGALGPGVCGSRDEFCGLFARGAALARCGGFVRAWDNGIQMGLTVCPQEAFGEGGWPIEFRAAVARLLSQHAPNDKEAPRKNTLRLSNERLDQRLSETMVLDLIVLVGFVVVNNPQLQEAICEGWSVVKTLCTLPANWLVSRSRSHALLPTLIALSEYPACAAAIASELSMTMLEEFLDNPEAQYLKLVQVIKQGRAKKPGKK
ncbi:uncharacterized protein LOC119836626 [Zerene cesonia]|uniref:uncharacterized protein LOC119836626 n=1 Tax=Zerene cesonia TaxID=33412 RepID=UPI0018E504B2|nr:uncharacterized protein LOC119836626 [Zerene cesonia]